MNSEPKANVLLDEHSGDPMVVLWRALNGRRPELAMAVINDPRCGIERKSIGGFELKSSMGKFNHAQGGCTPLMFAAFAGRTDVMIDLLAAGADVTASDFDRNFTPLHLAQSVEAVRLLIAHGCDVNARSSKGITPLRTFIGSPKSDIIALLVAEGADVKSVGETILHLALQQRPPSIEVIRMLIDRGCDVDAGAGEYELTPLHKAAANGFSEIARLLISEGASVTRLSRYMYTDHMQGPNQQSIQALLDAGCDVTSLTAKGNRGNPLHYALTVATIALLVDEGAEVNEPDALGDTPLHKAFSRNLHEGGELLISRGARVNAVNAKGQGPLHVAAEKGRLGTIRLLREQGADTNLRDENGRTAHEVFVQSARTPWLDIYQTMGMRHLSASEKQDAKDLLAPTKKRCVIC